MADLAKGDIVRFAHEQNGGPVHRIVSVMSDGMVEIHDMGGYFAPHLFVVATDIADIPAKIPECRCDDVYLDTIRRLELDIAMLDRAAALASIAISLKRIADALNGPTNRDTALSLLREIEMNLRKN
jgi:hypothetical protein